MESTNKLDIKYRVGNLVIYRNKCAAVVALNGDKLDIRVAGGDSRSVRAKDIEFLHAGSGASTPQLPPPTAPTPDCSEVAELMESESFAFAEFIELAYGEYNGSTAWSGYALLQEGIYFSGSIAQGVTAKPAEEVVKILAKQSEKLAAQNARNDFLERVKTGELLPEDRPLLRDVEQVALQLSESSKTLRELGIEATPEKAQLLLLRVGAWDYLTNPWPSRYGVELVDPDLTIPELPDEERIDLTHMVALAIDDADSHDPDDAISYEDGLLWVHIADPSAVVTPKSELDNEAASRGSNLYIPEQVVHMLPTSATAIFGLGLNETSPAMSFAIKIGDDGSAVLEKIVLSTVKVTRCDYESTEKIWHESPLKEIRPMLERFKERRSEDGALLIQMPEVKVKLRDGKVYFQPVPISDVRELVANSMLATGSAVAKYCAEHDIAMPFVSQPPPESEERGESLVAMYELRKSCLPSCVTTIAGRHAGLALEPYIRVTSPLRRYGDLVAHQQLRRVITGFAPMSSSEIEERIVLSEDGTNTRRKLERQCNEYWTLVYLQQNPEWQGISIPVYRQDDRLTWLIPEFAYEYKNRFGGKVELGESYNVKLNAVEPASLSVRFMMVRELEQ